MDFKNIAAAQQFIADTHEKKGRPFVTIMLTAVKIKAVNSMAALLTSNDEQADEKMREFSALIKHHNTHVLMDMLVLTGMKPQMYEILDYADRLINIGQDNIESIREAAQAAIERARTRAA